MATLSRIGMTIRKTILAIRRKMFLLIDRNVAGQRWGHGYARYLGSVTATAMSLCGRLAGKWNGFSHGYYVRLVMVSNDSTGDHACTGQGPTK
jgi:hypothetical protein